MAEDLPTFDDMQNQEAKEKLPSFDEMAKSLPPSEPDFFTNFGGGLTSIPRGIEQLGEKLITDPPYGNTKLPKKPKDEGVVKANKAKPAEPDPQSLGYALGEMAFPMGAVGTAAKLGKEVTPAVAGGLTGLLSPVEGDGSDFYKKKIGQGVLGLGLGYVMQYGGKAASAGVYALGDWLARRLPETKQLNIEGSAINTILQRIQRDNKYGAPNAIDMLNLTAASSKPLTLQDVGGPTLQSLGGRTLRTPGEPAATAKGFLMQRDQGALQRLNKDIDQYVFSGPTMQQTAEGLLLSRSAAARPLYEQTDQLQGIYSPRLGEFIGKPDADGVLVGANPEIAEGMKRGFRIERNTSLAEGRPFNPTMMGVDIDAQGNIQLLRTPNMRVLDMAKQGLDSMVAEQRDPLTGRLSALGLSFEKIRREYVKELDGLDTSGVYKKAREAWQGPSRALDALRTGRAVFGQSPEINAKAFADATEGDREFMKIGMADIMRERLMKSRFNSDESKALLNSPWMTKQIEPFFKSKEDFNDFVKAVTDERMMATTASRAAGGSQTAERLAEDATKGVKIPFWGAMKTAMGGHVFPVLYEMWRLNRDASAKPNPEIDAAIAKILFAPDIAQTEMGKRLAMGPQSVQGNQLKGVADLLLRAGGSPLTTAGIASGSGMMNIPANTLGNSDQ